MKCLTVQQPWAWALIFGGKDVENRSWATNHRGPLLIHAGQKFTTDGADNLMVRRALERITPEVAMPNYERGGVVLGAVDIVDCIQNSESLWAMDGQWHWVVENPRPLVFPLERKGRLGLWDVPLLSTDIFVQPTGAAQ